MAEAGSIIAWKTPRSLTDTLRAANLFVTTTTSGTASSEILTPEEQLIRENVRFFPIDWPVADPIVVDPEETPATLTYVGADTAESVVLEIPQPVPTTADDPLMWIETNWAILRGHNNEWVVLEVDPTIGLVGFAQDFAQAIALARQRGVRSPFVAKVPSEDLPTLIA